MSFPGLCDHKAPRAKDSLSASLWAILPPPPAPSFDGEERSGAYTWARRVVFACSPPPRLKNTHTHTKHGVCTPSSERGPRSRGGSSSRRAQATQVGGSGRGRAAAGPGKPKEGCRAPRSNSRHHQLTSCSPPSSSLKAPANERVGKAGPTD